MSSLGQPAVAQQAASRGAVSSLLSDHVQLVKLRVTTLVVMTAWCGYYLGAVKSGIPSLSWTLLHAMLGIGIVSAGAATLNELVERESDARMRRTADRPLPAGRMSPAYATLLGSALVLGGGFYLALTTNRLTGILALATAITYLVAYTPLKQISPLCTFIGAFPGAMPPALGWTAIRGRLEWEALALFAIVFLWQFPHFHAIGWLYAEDYDSAGIRMLPAVEKDGRSTAREIILYGLALIPVSLAPTFLYMTGRLYLAAALVLTLAYFFVGFQLARQKMAPTDPASKKAARRLLQASVLYLPLLFAIMMLDTGAL